jgi:FkbM family methyltransferase
MAAAMNRELHIDGLNRHESDYLYDEIFVRRAYLRHGLTLSESEVVFDVGANIGVFSLFAAAECPTASVYAFEPLPPIFEKLERNTRRLAGRAHLFRCGLSDSAGEARFTYYPGYSTMSAVSTYADTGAEKDFVKRQVLSEQTKWHSDPGMLKHLDDLLEYRFQERHFQCQLRRMSDVIDECALKRIDFLKIDVQRAELDVLEGIRGEHWPLIRQIAMEVHDRSVSPGGPLQQVVENLRDGGFHVVTEQDNRVSGSDRHTVFASRRPA